MTSKQKNADKRKRFKNPFKRLSKLSAPEKKEMPKNKDHGQAPKKPHRTTKKTTTKQKRERLRNRQLLRKYLDKAGYESIDESKFTKGLFNTIIFICLGLSFLTLLIAIIAKPGIRNSILFLTGVWTGIFAGLFVLGWVLTYIFLDVKIFKRTAQIEDVLPDYLQLASANISAGMPIDRALWFAVRPRFGILAKEIEEVAKATVSGEDLKESLRAFTAKYDSVVLKRSINLLLEGMESGGQIADLLNKISMNIQETKILKKEMAANVMTYAIFIGFASVVAAPVLFGLSGQLLIVIQKIMGLLATSGSGGGASSGMFSLSTSGNTISLHDFRIFSVLTLIATSMFSSFIISTIRRGSVKQGLGTLPVFIAVSLVIYYLASWMLSLLFGGLMTL